MAYAVTTTYLTECECNFWRLCDQASMAGAIPSLERKYVKTKVSNLNGAMMAAESLVEKREEVLRYIQSVEDDPQFQLDPEFPSGLDWFNTPSPLSFSQQLRGKLVVLDFFTYCCINCMHILPDLERLEERYPADSGGVIVIGVHSAKFGNEKVSENIRRAIERYCKIKVYILFNKVT